MPKLVKRLPAASGDAAAPPPAAAEPDRADVARIHPDDGALGWLVQPHDDKPSWDADLSVFASGSREEGIAARPGLIADLAPAIRANSKGRDKRWFGRTRSCLKVFWSLLDDMERRGAGNLDGAADVGDATGQIFKTWLLQERGSGSASARMHLGTMRALLSASKRRRGDPDWDLAWPTVAGNRGTEHKDVDPEILKPLYSTLKSHHARCGRAMKEGAELLRRGVDPRTVGDGADRDAWSDPANVAVLAREYVTRVLDEPGTQMRHVAKRFAEPGNHGLPAFGPSALGPPAGRSFDAVRWFVPTFDDTACAFFLVLMHTGWNPDTVANIDVSSDRAWFDTRLGVDGEAGKGTVAIYGHKGRVGKEQIAFSLVKPHGHPYRVVRAMVERTEPLRDGLRRRLAALERSGCTREDERREAAELRSMIKSPWLYFTRTNARSDAPCNRVGVVSASTDMLLRSFRDFAGEALRGVYRAHEDAAVRERHRPLLAITPSDLRDGFASFVYENSLYNILLLKRALEHGHASTTRAYIRQRRQLAERFREFVEHQNRFFDEIRRFRRVDPTILFLGARFGEVTPEQRARLADDRLRTRMGMGCLDPRRPPEDIAPGHEGGDCGVQRCTICVHGVVFAESFPALAVRMAELRFIRGRAAQERFESSSFLHEWLAIEWTVSNFFLERSAEFEDAVRAHLAELKAGRAYLFDQVPPSFLRAEAA